MFALPLVDQQALAPNVLSVGSTFDNEGYSGRLRSDPTILVHESISWAATQLMALVLSHRAVCTGPYLSPQDHT
jgi:hypothetical protein